MLEERKITSQQTIFAVLRESILIFLSSANVTSLRFTAQFTFFTPSNIFWLSEVVGISIGLILDLQERKMASAFSLS